MYSRLDCIGHAMHASIWADDRLEVQVMQYNKFKDTVYGILEPGGADSRFFDPFIITLIILNVFAVILESVSWLRIEYFSYFLAFNIFSIAVFTIEYSLRVWSCTSNPQYSDPVRGRLRYMITPMAIIDLLAFLPFYLPLMLPDLRFLRSIRIFRLFRFLKLARYSKSLNTFVEVIDRTKGELGLLIFVIVLLVIISSSMMYEAERETQPEIFTSIPAAMWWSIVTLTTVGYGDMYPVTLWGKLIGTISVLIGLCLIALLTSILASGFTEVIEEKRDAERCPHCGELLREVK